MKQQHRCRAPGCVIDVADDYLMCRTHWRQVPPDLRNAVNSAYRGWTADMGDREALWALQAQQRRAVESLSP